MGRDFTPREYHKVDLRYGFSKQDMTYTDMEGNVVVLYKHDCPMAKRYPNLYFLFEPMQHIDWSNEELDLLDTIENALTSIIASDKRENSTLSKWYFGELDKDFYYNHRNNELLLEWITKTFKLILLEGEKK